MAFKHTVLVVDDEPDVVRSVRDLLRLDYKVLGATRAEDGLKLLEKETVHVVMTDQRMPGVTGVEFLNQVRGDFPDAVRLLFTGYADINAVIEAINQGNVYRYITKPWNPDELLSVIREACERYDLMVERARMIGTLKTQNEELERANARLQESDRLKHAFIKVASHELRTPLTILNGVLHLVKITPGLQPPHKEWVSRCAVGGHRMQVLVNQLISMLSANRFGSLFLEDVTFPSLLLEAVEDVRPFVTLRNQNLVVDVPEGDGVSRLDAAKIRDCVNNLLLNAIKFTPDGGTISVRSTTREDGGNDVSVTDTGVGLDEVSLKQLFRPFFTSFDVSRHSSGVYEFNRKGIGLGLSVVKAFVEMHGGTVDVTSKVDQGSTFTIHLPKVAEAAASPPAEF